MAPVKSPSLCSRLTACITRLGHFGNRGQTIDSVWEKSQRAAVLSALSVQDLTLLRGVCYKLKTGGSGSRRPKPLNLHESESSPEQAEAQGCEAHQAKDGNAAHSRGTEPQPSPQAQGRPPHTETTELAAVQDPKKAETHGCPGVRGKESNGRAARGGSEEF